MEEPAIIVRNLRKTFGDFVAVDDVSFVVPRGTVLGLLGPNGAGKTTTVRMLSTLLRPDAGEVIVSGFSVEHEAAEVRKRIGLTGQYAAVDENLTGTENLEMIARLHHMTGQEARARAEELLAQFGLTDAANKTAKAYSGGMRRRLDLAASLVAHPDVVFLDEPTTGLDPKSRLDLWKILEDLVKQGTTILLTTQYLEEADYLADEIIMIDHGKIVARGTASDLKKARGGDVLELHVSDVTRAEDACALLRDLHPDGEVRADDVGMISLPVTDHTKSMIEVLRRLDKAQIELADIVLRRPTLDEVFLDLTGNKE